MKKLSALLLAFILILLCSCSDSNNASTPTDASESEASSTTIKNGKTPVITEWGTDLLPDSFPPPPNGTHDFTIEQKSAGADGSAYATDFLKLTFVCPEHEFYSFTNKLLELGYIGGSKKVTGGSYYSDGYHGYWQNGETYIKIAKASEAESGEMIFELEVTRCTDNFPEALEQYFLKFNGYCIGKGSFCGHNGNGEKIESEFTGSFGASSWHWEFRFGNGFAGVTREEFEDYFYAVEKSGYSGVLLTNTVDDFTIMAGDLVKSTPEGEYGVFMFYNTVLKTLEIAYTNDASIYTGS